MRTTLKLTALADHDGAYDRRWLSNVALDVAFQFFSEQLDSWWSFEVLFKK